METRDILALFIFPEDPVLARRIDALFWSYERSRVRHSVQHDLLVRRAPRNEEEPPRPVTPAQP